MNEIFVPLLICLAGVVAMTIYVLAVAVRELSRRIIKTDEKLIILLGTREGPETGRALVASVRKPKRDLPGVAKEQKKEEKPKGYQVTVGAR